ncbi:MAG: type II secretion system protein [Acidobacteria bacterium]|nr:type II secretion system protein [Acidobacteriota bacterium]
MTPNDEVKVTTVPFCTGVPADSVTDAVTVADPFTGTVVVLTVRVMVDSVGASSGTLSHADQVNKPRRTAMSTEREDDTGKAKKDNRRMELAGQGSRASERGYAMAALLVGLNVMAVLMAVALPVWSHANRREREEELVWRGQQYYRAIRLFQRKYANSFPPSIDVLVEQRFLRKKYKDPITNDDFEIIPVGANPNISGGTNLPGGPGSKPATQLNLGIQGVMSKSKEQSIRLLNGMNTYNQWSFVPMTSTITGGNMTGPPGSAGGAFGPGGGAGGFGTPGSAPGMMPGGAGAGAFGAPGQSGAPGPFGTPMQTQPAMPPPPGGMQPFNPQPGGFGQPGGMGTPGVPGGTPIFTPVKPPA